MDFCSIKTAAKRGPVPECRLRAWVKDGLVPGFYSGNRYLVNYELFIKQLYDDCGTDRRVTTNK